MKTFEIAVDFDGTCVEHLYPNIGKDVPKAVETLLELREKGHSLILYTMRSGIYLSEAIDWFKDRDIVLYAVQKNPTQETWTKSPKCYAQIYIDNAALGCPLVYPTDGTRPYVNWVKVRELLVDQNVL